MESFQISLSNGITIKFNNNQKIFLDPKISDSISFVSHAHSDHIPRKIITPPYCTKETYELIKLKQPNFKANVLKENRKMKFDEFSVKLISSGHMLGASQVFIELDGCSILYTGDFKLWQGLTSKAINIQEADVLITEATYGLPKFNFPLIEETREKLIRWVMEQLKKGYNVNLGCYPVGKSQEVIKLLNRYGLIPQVSESVRKYSEVYNSFGVNLKFLEKEESERIFIRPMHIVYRFRSKKAKSCVLTGWALFKNYGCFGLPLSDHCDFNQLILFAQQVNPKQVYCFHGYVNELAREIRKKLKAKTRVIQKQGQKLLTQF
ncbi:MAG: MBL fold metallo-hydrolase [Candidatus Aenigmarchaeota archaeon]|nr:MBL fold metallo-hydrolase [Candidatus Aenigmarchaeota archaeon]